MSDEELYDQALAILAEMADRAHEEERQTRTMPRINGVLAARAAALNEAFDAILDLKKEDDGRENS